MRRLPYWRWTVLLLALAMFAASCGGGDDDGGTEAGGDDTEETTETTAAGISTTVGGSDDEADGDGEDEGDDEPVEVAAASGTLRMVEFSPVTTFDPAGSQTAQSAYLYPVYDTLTRQNADFTLAPALATAWEQPEPTTWVFTLRDDVVFHDGSAFNGQVAADNMTRAQAFEGNPNAATWAAMESAEATGDHEVTVTFSRPQPQFPIQMSMVMGMMVSGEAMAAGTDLTRNPQGSGPWQWSEAESEAGVTEVYDLFDGHWNPADQGVERVEVTAVPDNNARANALLSGDADIMATTRDAQIDDLVDAGNDLLTVPNYFPYLVITGRDGGIDEPLADERVRQAIALSIDRDTYNASIHAGKGDSLGGVYPPAFGDWHDGALDGLYSYDPDRAKELLAEAGYGDGVTIQMPIMPAIQPHVDLTVQMLGATGIDVELIQINNGELGPRTRQGEWGITWFRDLLYHPANDLPKFVEGGTYDIFGVGDTDDIAALLASAAELSPADAKPIYAEAVTELVERGILIPLAHGGQNAVAAPTVTGAVLGLNMQAPMPYGVRVDG
jgi:peptide/nickel transport system substrate-binding protein